MKKEYMPSILKKTIMFFRLRSVFSKILIVLFILIIGIFGLFYLVISRNYQQNSQEDRINAGFGAMSLSGNRLEENIIKLETQINELLDVTILERIVVSGDVFSNPETIDIVRELKTLADDNELIEKAFLYVENSNALISSDQTVKPLEETEELQVVEYYQQLESGQNLIFYKKGIYVFCEIPQGRRMAICAVKVDRNELYSQFRETTATLKMDFKVYPFWGDEPLFDDQIHYPPESEFMIVGREVRQYGYEICELADGEGLLLAHNSGRFNIRLLGFLDDTYNELSLGEILLEGLPVWIVAALLVLLTGMILIVMVYRPLGKVLNYIMSHRTPGNRSSIPEDIKNEFELISGLFQEQKNYERELSELLHKTGEAVTDRVLLDIIEGNEQSEESVKILLSQIKSDFNCELCYQIILIDIIKNEDDPFSTAEQEMYKIMIRQFSQDYWYGKAQINILNRNDQQSILVLGFAQNFSVRRVKNMVKEFSEGCADKFREYSCTPILSISSMRSDVFGLSEAFAEAKTGLQEKLYYNTYSSSQRDVVTIYKNKIHLCLERMIHEPDEAGRELAAILKNSENYPEEAPLIRLNYMDSVLEYLLRYRVPCEEHWLEWRNMFTGEPENVVTNGEHQEVLKRFFEETTVCLREAAGHVQMQYLDSAKRYIKNHYGDSNLSLVVVSENCGISKGYLSRLFMQYSKGSFTDYLNQYRVQQACELLTNTSFTILEVGFKTGFNSPQSFNRVFKKYMSYTPTQYRMQRKEEQ